MRLKRIELVIITIRLAFAVFTGGFFTGRNYSTVSIAAQVEQSDGTLGSQVSITHEYGNVPQNPSAKPQASEIQLSIGITEAAALPQNPENVGSPQSSGTPVISDGKININTATHGELTDLPGIGTALASRIIDYRTQNGSFAKIEDIKNVSGIAQRRFDAIKDLIKVN